MSRSDKRISLVVMVGLICIGAGVGVVLKLRSDVPAPAGGAVTPANASATENAATAARSDKPITAFIVHSYEQDNVCGDNQDAGITAALREQFGDRVTLVRHFMNTKTVNRSKADMQADASRALAKIAEVQPDIVFTVDDNAFREVGLSLLGAETPVVFTGMNGQPATYNKATPFLDAAGRPAANITGVYEKLQLAPSLRVLKMVLPQAKKVVVLLDDSTTGHAIRVQMQKELPDNDTGIEVDIRMVSSVGEYREQITRINNDPGVDAVYNVVLSIADQQGRHLTARQTFREYLQACSKPSLALNFTFSKLGLFGGASVDFEAMGHKAGHIGCRLLEGEAIANLPVVDAERVMITFNKARADALGIAIPPELLTASQLFHSIPLLDDAGE